MLGPLEIEYLRRFSELRSYAPGEALAEVGDPGHGLTIILGGEVKINQRDESDHRVPITTHGPGSPSGMSAFGEALDRPIGPH